MHKHRIILLFTAAIGVLAIFLPWYTLPMVEGGPDIYASNFKPFHVLLPVSFGLIGATVLLGKWSRRPGLWAYILMDFFSLLPLLMGSYVIYIFETDKGSALFSIGSGLYLTIGAGLVIVTSPCFRLVEQKIGQRRGALTTTGQT